MKVGNFQDFHCCAVRYLKQMKTVGNDKLEGMMSSVNCSQL